MAALNSSVCVATGGLYFLGEPGQISAVNRMTPLTGANYVLLHGDTASSLFNEAHPGSSECAPDDLEDLWQTVTPPTHDAASFFHHQAN